MQHLVKDRTGGSHLKRSFACGSKVHPVLLWLIFRALRGKSATIDESTALPKAKAMAEQIRALSI
jgi:hypothetical protein